MGTYVCICIAIEENILTISIGTYIYGVLVNDHSSSFEVVVFTPHLVSSIYCWENTPYIYVPSGSRSPSVWRPIWSHEAAL